MGHNSAPGSPDTDILALRPGGGLGLTARLMLEAKANWLGKKGCEAHFNFQRDDAPASGRFPSGA